MCADALRNIYWQHGRCRVQACGLCPSDSFSLASSTSPTPSRSSTVKKLEAERVQGADPEDPDEYRARISSGCHPKRAGRA
jgi:hypothetical protein